MATLNPRWEYQNVHDLLIACVGLNYGERPEENVEAIRRDRALHGRRIRQILELKATDRVADIGSGCGFVAREIVPNIAHLCCVDVSSDFLEYCKTELSSFTNVSYYLVRYGDFSDITSASLSACYSTAVFIHFNYYDFIIHLKECNRILAPGGRLVFDFLNADILEYRQQRAFFSHLSNYKAARETKIFNLVHPMSLRALENLTRQVGFSVSRVDFLPNSANTTILLRKIADAD